MNLELFVSGPRWLPHLLIGDGTFTVLKGVSWYQVEENPGLSYRAGTSTSPQTERGGAQRPADTQISDVLQKGNGAKKEMKRQR